MQPTKSTSQPKKEHQQPRETTKPRQWLLKWVGHKLEFYPVSAVIFTGDFNTPVNCFEDEFFKYINFLVVRTKCICNWDYIRHAYIKSARAIEISSGSSYGAFRI